MAGSSARGPWTSCAAARACGSAAQPLDEAERLLGSLRGVHEVERDDDGLRIAAEPAAAPTINRALVEAGIAVSELRPERASLEKVFLELTNEEEEA